MTKLLRGGYAQVQGALACECIDQGIGDVDGDQDTGIELDVYDNSGTHLGDLIVTKTKLIWCKGKTSRKNGQQVTWEQFIRYMEDK